MSIDPTKLKVARTVDRSGIAFCVARVPGTARLFYGAGDAKVYELDFAAEKPEAKEMSGHTGYVLGIALAGKQVVSGAYDGKLIWWDSETREKVREVAAHGKWIRGVVASPDGKVVASVADDMLCKLWNADTGEPLRTLAGHEPLTPQHYPSMLYGCCFSADGRLVATCDKVGHIVVWDIASGEKLAALEAPVMYTWDPRQRRHSIGGARSVAFSPDGRLLAVGGTGQINNIDHLEAYERTEIFDWREGKRLFEIVGDKFKGLAEAMQFHPSGNWLIAAGGSTDGFVKFIDAASGKVVSQEKSPVNLHGFVLGDTGDSLIAVGHGKLVSFEFKAEAEAATE